MEKYYTIVFMLLVAILSAAAENDCTEKLGQLERRIAKSERAARADRTKIAELNAALSLQAARQDSLAAAIADSMNETAAKNAKKFCGVEASIDETKRDAATRVQWVAVAGSGVAACLLAAFVLAVVRQRRKTSAVDTTIEAVHKAQKTLEDNMCQINGKLVEVLNRQVEAMPKAKAEAAPDHSLVLKVSDEVARIEVNLSRMDQSVKGHKQLSKAVERIKNNLLAKGYEMTDMLGKSYNEGMRVEADFMIDESLPLGSRTITSVRKPEVLYNGEIIQKANIMVSQNI